MACLVERQKHERNRAGNVVVEMRDVVWRRGELPRYGFTAGKTVATKLNDTLHKPPRIRAEYSYTSSCECEST